MFYIIWILLNILINYFFNFLVNVNYCLLGTIQKQSSSNEQLIKQRILKKYDRTTRPVKDDKTLVHVNVAISLYHILDTVIIILSN